MKPKLNGTLIGFSFCFTIRPQCRSGLALGTFVQYWTLSRLEVNSSHLSIAWKQHYDYWKGEKTVLEVTFNWILISSAFSLQLYRNAVASETVVQYCTLPKMPILLRRSQRWCFTTDKRNEMKRNPIENDSPDPLTLEHFPLKLKMQAFVAQEKEKLIWANFFRAHNFTSPDFQAFKECNETSRSPGTGGRVGWVGGWGRLTSIAEPRSQRRCRWGWKDAFALGGATTTE